jgi:hypothetical protein
MWGRERIKGERCWGDLTNIQYKPIWNCHNESTLYNRYILIKKIKIKKCLVVFLCTVLALRL